VHAQLYSVFNANGTDKKNNRFYVADVIDSDNNRLTLWTMFENDEQASVYTKGSEVTFTATYYSYGEKALLWYL
jgi:hypothetical protein